MRRWYACAILATIVSARAAAEPEAPAAPPSTVPASPAPAAAAAAASAAAVEPPAAPPAPPALPVLVDAPEATRREPSTGRRVLGVAAALGPGFFLRGAGSFVVGEKRAAKRLLQIGAVGLTTAAIGGIAIGTTGAPPELVWPGVPLTLIGAGLFLPTWFADIWVAAGGQRVRGRPIGAPPWSLELSTTGLRDPFRSRVLTGAAARVELGRLGLSTAGLLDAQGNARTGELEARWRLLGAPAGNGVITEGSRLFVRAAGRYHRDDTDDVTLATAEAEVVARAELRHLDPLLEGTFLDLSLGLGVERATYARGAHDVDSLLLSRFAWGAYLGRRGEATLFYDHRRDHLAGGLFTWRASGFNGSFGASAQLELTGPWAVRAEIELGNAWLATAALRYHGGSR